MQFQFDPMGNCLVGERNPTRIRVATWNGGVMEFHGPVTVESITEEFPRHGIFRSHDLFWKPLSHSDLLLSGESYSLLPLCEDAPIDSARAGHVRSSGGAVDPPYRMSFDSRGPAKAVDEADVGFWKVKLVISRAQLLEILAEDGRRTEEFIESVRTVAKCGSIGGPSGAFSDQWSLSSSRNETWSASKDSSSLLQF